MFETQSIVLALVSFLITGLIVNKIEVTVSKGGLVEALSSIDNRKYYVMNTNNKVDAANLLATTRQRIDAVLRQLAEIKIHPANVRAGVKRILKKHPTAQNVNLYEMNSEVEDGLAYNLNKNNIFICLREFKGKEKLAAEDVVLFIALHELAHSMTSHYDPNVGGHTVHSKIFKEHEVYLHDVASNLFGFFDSKLVPGRAHCGAKIIDPNVAL